MTPARALLLAAALGTLIAARPPMRYQPNPSSVFAAEIAFNRLAQDKGQWTAFRATAAEDAVMFVPQRISARQWLKGRADPPRSVRWTPSTIIVSCDGNLAASTGNWQGADGAAGYFTTMWRRDKHGAWRWILDHGDTLAKPREVPEFLIGKVATCKQPARAKNGAPSPGGTSAASPADESLVWSADVATDGSRRITVRAWNGSGYDLVIDDKVAAPGV